MSFEIMQLATGSSSLSSYLNFISTIPRLEEDEEKTLLTDLLLNNCKIAAQKLVFHHLRLVAFLAKRYERPNIHLQDLIQEGNVALMIAISKYDPQKTTTNRLATFAAKYIVGAFKEYVRKNLKIIAIGTTKALKKAVNHLWKYTQSGELTQANKVQMAEDLGINISDVETAYQQYSLQCISTYISDDEENLDIIVEDSRYDPSKLLLQYEREVITPNQLEQHINKLSTREQDIIRRRFFCEQPVTFVELSKEYNVSLQRIAQIESMAIAKLKDMHFS